MGLREFEEELLETGALGRAEVGEDDAAVQRGAADGFGVGVDDERAVLDVLGVEPASSSAISSASASVARTSTPAPASSSSREPSATIRPLPMISS